MIRIMDEAEIVSRARMCGARYGDILTLTDGTRWRFTREGLVPASQTLSQD